MIKLFEKYTLRELFFSFILSFLALNMILMMEKVLRVSRLLSGVGASAFDFLRMILLIQPRLFQFTIPMSFLMAVLFTYTRFNMDNEIVIFKAAGMSFKGIARPVFLFGIICFLLSLLTSFYLSPNSDKAFKKRITSIITSKAPLAIEEGVFFTLFKGVVVFVEEKLSETSLKNVFIYDERNKERPKVIFAKNGKIDLYEDLGIGFVLKHGNVFLMDDLSMTELQFKGYTLAIKFDPSLGVKNSELTPLELLKGAKEKKGINKIKMYLEFHKRMTLPLMVLLISFLAPPLGMISGKTGRLGGLSLGILVFAFYYYILLYFENFAKSGKIPHYIGGWIPLLLFALVSLYLFRREAKK